MIRVAHAVPTIFIAEHREIAVAGATGADPGEDSVPIPVIKNGFSSVPIPGADPHE